MEGAVPWRDIELGFTGPRCHFVLLCSYDPSYWHHDSSSPTDEEFEIIALSAYTKYYDTLTLNSLSGAHMCFLGGRWPSVLEEELWLAFSFLFGMSTEHFSRVRGISAAMLANSNQNSLLVSHDFCEIGLAIKPLLPLKHELTSDHKHEAYHDAYTPSY